MATAEAAFDDFIKRRDERERERTQYLRLAEEWTHFQRERDRQTIRRLEAENRELQHKLAVAHARCCRRHACVHAHGAPPTCPSPAGSEQWEQLGATATGAAAFLAQLQRRGAVIPRELSDLLHDKLARSEVAAAAATAAGGRDRDRDRRREASPHGRASRDTSTSHPHSNISSSNSSSTKVSKKPVSGSRKRRHDTTSDGADVFTDVANSIVKDNGVDEPTTPRSPGSKAGDKSDADDDADGEEDEVQRPAAKRAKFAQSRVAAGVLGAERVARDKYSKRLRGSKASDKSDADDDVDREEDEMQRPAVKRVKFAQSRVAAGALGAERVARDKTRNSVEHSPSSRGERANDDAVIVVDSTSYKATSSSPRDSSEAREPSAAVVSSPRTRSHSHARSRTRDDVAKQSPRVRRRSALESRAARGKSTDSGVARAVVEDDAQRPRTRSQGSGRDDDNADRSPQRPRRRSIGASAEASSSRRGEPRARADAPAELSTSASRCIRSSNSSSVASSPRTDDEHEASDKLDNRFKCLIRGCEYATKKKWNLQRHQERHHKDVLQQGQAAFDDRRLLSTLIDTRSMQDDDADAEEDGGMVRPDTSDERANGSQEERRGSSKPKGHKEDAVADSCSDVARPNVSQSPSTATRQANPPSSVRLEPSKSSRRETKDPSKSKSRKRRPSSQRELRGGKRAMPTLEIDTDTDTMPTLEVDAEIVGSGRVLLSPPMARSSSSSRRGARSSSGAVTSLSRSSRGNRVCCIVCKATFDVRAFGRHVAEAHAAARCKECAHVVRGALAMTQHTETFHPGPTFRCRSRECVRMFYTERQRAEHVIATHPQHDPLNNNTWTDEELEPFVKKARAAGAEGEPVKGYRAMLNECVDTGNRVVDELLFAALAKRYTIKFGMDVSASLLASGPSAKNAKPPSLRAELPTCPYCHVFLQKSEGLPTHVRKKHPHIMELGLFSKRRQRSNSRHKASSRWSKKGAAAGGAKQQLAITSPRNSTAALSPMGSSVGSPTHAKPPTPTLLSAAAARVAETHWSAKSPVSPLALALAQSLKPTNTALPSASTSTSASPLASTAPPTPTSVIKCSVDTQVASPKASVAGGTVTDTGVGTGTGAGYIIERTSAGAFMCPYCDRTFQKFRFFRNHVRDHELEFPCPYCDESLPSREANLDHIWERHQPPKYSFKVPDLVPLQKRLDELASTAGVPKLKVAHAYFRKEVFNIFPALKEREGRLPPLYLDALAQKCGNINLEISKNEKKRQRNFVDDRRMGVDLLSADCPRCGLAFSGLSEYWTHCERVHCVTVPFETRQGGGGAAAPNASKKPNAAPREARKTVVNRFSGVIDDDESVAAVPRTRRGEPRVRVKREPEESSRQRQPFDPSSVNPSRRESSPPDLNHSNLRGIFQLERERYSRTQDGRDRSGNRTGAADAFAGVGGSLLAALNRLRLSPGPAQALSHHLSDASPLARYAPPGHSFFDFTRDMHDVRTGRAMPHEVIESHDSPRESRRDVLREEWERQRSREEAEAERRTEATPQLRDSDAKERPVSARIEEMARMREHQLRMAAVMHQDLSGYEASPVSQSSSPRSSHNPIVPPGYLEHSDTNRYLTPDAIMAFAREHEQRARMLALREYARDNREHHGARPVASESEPPSVSPEMRERLRELQHRRSGGGGSVVSSNFRSLSDILSSGVQKKDDGSSHGRDRLGIHQRDRDPRMPPLQRVVDSHGHANANDTTDGRRPRHSSDIDSRPAKRRRRTASRSHGRDLTTSASSSPRSSAAVMPRRRQRRFDAAEAHLDLNTMRAEAEARSRALAEAAAMQLSDDDDHLRQQVTRAQIRRQSRNQSRRSPAATSSSSRRPSVPQSSRRSSPSSSHSRASSPRRLSGKRLGDSKHSATDSTEKPFVCVLCARGFDSQRALSNHNTVHQSPHSCGVDGCDDTFPTRRQQMIHEMHDHPMADPLAGWTDEELLPFVEAIRARKKPKGDTKRRPPSTPYKIVFSRVCKLNGRPNPSLYFFLAVELKFKIKFVEFRSLTLDKSYRCAEARCAAEFLTSGELAAHRRASHPSSSNKPKPTVKACRACGCNVKDGNLAKHQQVHSHLKYLQKWKSLNFMPFIREIRRLNEQGVMPMYPRAVFNKSMGDAILRAGFTHKNLCPSLWSALELVFDVRIEAPKESKSAAAASARRQRGRDLGARDKEEAVVPTDASESLELLLAYMKGGEDSIATRVEELRRHFESLADADANDGDRTSSAVDNIDKPRRAGAGGGSPEAAAASKRPMSNSRVSSRKRRTRSRSRSTSRAGSDTRQMGDRDRLGEDGDENGNGGTADCADEDGDMRMGAAAGQSAREDGEKREDGEVTERCDNDDVDVRKRHRRSRRPDARESCSGSDDGDGSDAGVGAGGQEGRRSVRREEGVERGTKVCGSEDGESDGGSVGRGRQVCDSDDDESSDGSLADSRSASALDNDADADRPKTRSRTRAESKRRNLSFADEDGDGSSSKKRVKRFTVRGVVS